MYLRSDLPSMRRVIFPLTIVCFVGEQNHEKYGPQSKQYLHSWDGFVTNGIRVMPQLEVWALHTRTRVLVRGYIVKDW